MILDDCYSPSHSLEQPEFLQACREHDRKLEHAFREMCRPARGLLVLTLDCEEFGCGTRREIAAYSDVLAGMAEILAAHGCGGTFCLQLEDSLPTSRQTPEAGARRVVATLGPEAIGFHCIDHVTRRPNGVALDRDVSYYRAGLQQLRARYGVDARYHSPPSWVLTHRSALALKEVPDITALRGVQSGPNFWVGDLRWTFSMPYLYLGKTHFPYQYVDWMFGDVFGRLLRVDILEMHARAARVSAEKGVFMETIGHPFRLAMGDVTRNLELFEQTLGLYSRAGIRIMDAAAATALAHQLFSSCGVVDSADWSPSIILRGPELPRRPSAPRPPGRLTLRNLLIDGTTGRRRIMHAIRSAGGHFLGRSGHGSAGEGQEP